MSRAPDLTETGRFAGRRPVRGLTEKSNFTQTCSLLSQYIKDKGSLGDLSLGIGSSLDGKGSILTSSSSKPETMNLNLLPVLETQSDSDRNAPSREVKSMDLFPQQASFRVPNPPEDTTKKPDFRPATKEPEKAQLTIFYAGKVHVYDDFPADKAKELMVLASKGSAIQTPASGSIDTVSGKDQHNSVGLAPSNSSLIPASSTNNPNLGKDQHNSGGLAPSNSNLVPPSATNNPSQGKDQHNSGGLARSNSNLVPPSATNNPNQDRAQPQRPPQPSSSDLPIARRVSLHRFLEKRKDRIGAKAPYQVGNPGEGEAPSSSKPGSEAGSSGEKEGPSSSKPAEVGNSGEKEGPSGSNSKPDKSRTWLGLGSQREAPSGSSRPQESRTWLGLGSQGEAAPSSSNSKPPEGRSNAWLGLSSQARSPQ